MRNARLAWIALRIVWVYGATAAGVCLLLYVCRPRADGHGEVAALLALPLLSKTTAMSVRYPIR